MKAMPRDLIPNPTRAVRAVANSLTWPPIPAARLRAADSLPRLHALVRRRPLIGFNAQIVRARYLQYLFETLACTSFVETGTRHGATSLAARELFGGQVFTVELDPAAWLFARLHVLLTRSNGIHQVRGDSRGTLERWLSSSLIGRRPMIYLDAHWNTDIPLRDEVRLAVRRGNCVVVIDDARVEHDPGFGYDAENGFTIGLEAVRQELPPERVVALQPAYAATDETGSRRGALVLLIDVQLPDPAPDPFAAALFRPVPLGVISTNERETN
jgi:hypothetical protein